MSIEAMKLALEAIQDLRGYRPDIDTAITALREATQQVEVTNEREAFESCALMEGSLFKRRADDPDKYWDGNVQDDWELWKARAALYSPAPQTKGQP